MAHLNVLVRPRLSDKGWDVEVTDLHDNTRRLILDYHGVSEKAAIEKARLQAIEHWNISSDTPWNTGPLPD